MSVAVDPAWQRRGIGAQLVLAFEAAASSRGAASLNLLTERDSNDETNSFYRNLGFRLVREVHGHPTMNEYEIELHGR